MKINNTISTALLATRRDHAIVARRAGDVGALMRDFAWVGLQVGREQMFRMAKEVNKFTRP